MKLASLPIVLLLALTLRSGVSARGERTETPRVAGQFLVAAPEMPDPRFRHSVIYMVHHDGAGAMGLVVNRPIGTISLAALLDHLGYDAEAVRGEIRVHWGGPVHGARGFVLHTGDYAVKSTEAVADGLRLALTSEPEILRAIAHDTGPRRALFVLGHSGWGPGQLEAEIASGMWVTVSADEALVFDEDADTKWQRAMARSRITL